jgi:hypothetical protein
LIARLTPETTVVNHAVLGETVYGKFPYFPFSLVSRETGKKDVKAGQAANNNRIK